MENFNLRLVTPLVLSFFFTFYTQTYNLEKLDISTINYKFPNNPLNKQSEVTYLLKIKFPNHIIEVPKIIGCYKGYRLEFENNLCFIEQSYQGHHQFVLIITPEIEPKLEGNNVKYLERKNDKPCRLFYLTGKYDQTFEKNKINWQIEEENSENIPTRLPEDALVLLTNPRFVRGVKSIPNESMESMQDLDSLIILPEVILKNEITQKELNESSVYSLLASLDSNAICTPPIKKASNHIKTVVISKTLFKR